MKEKVIQVPDGTLMHQQFDAECPHCWELNRIEVAQIVGGKEHGEFNHKCYYCGKGFKIRY